MCIKGFSLPSAMRRNRIRDLFAYRSLRLKIMWALTLSPSPWAYSLWLYTSLESPSASRASALIEFAFSNLDQIACANYSCMWLTFLFVPVVQFLEVLSVSQFRHRSFLIEKRKCGTAGLPEQRSMLPLSEMIPDTEFPIWLTAMQAEYISHVKWIPAHKSLRLFCASHLKLYKFSYNRKQDTDIKRSVFLALSVDATADGFGNSVSHFLSDSQDLYS